MRFLIFQFILVSFSLPVFCQQPQGTPIPQATPPPIPQSSPTPRASVQNPASGALSENPSLLTPPFSNTVGDTDRLATRIIALRQITAPLYRKPTDRELRAVEPDPKWSSIYPFANGRNGGVVRLMPDLGCAKNTRVINASEDCIKLSMPGAANSYSFRTRNYRIKRLADITLDGEYISLTGVFMNGAISEVPNTEIQDIDLQEAAIQALAAMPPAAKYEQIEDLQAQIENGIESSGLRISNRATVRLGATYVFRGIAYRGRVTRAAAGIAYNELDFDKRRDIIVAFKITEISDDRSVTIVYRILRESEAPKIKVPKLSRPSIYQDENK